MEDVAVPVVRPVTTAPTVERELDERLRRFLLDPAFEAGVEVQRLDGVWEVPRQPAIYQTADNGAWLFSNHQQDFAALELGGSIAAPREQIQRLHALAEAGLACDVVGIAHELPAGWTPGQRLVPDPPKDRRQREVLQGFAKLIGAASRATAQAAGTAAQATAVAAAGLAVIALGTAVATAAAVAAPAVAVASSAPDALLSLDPIIYGGVEQEGRVKWVELARWNWE
jgi:hypothetical protein